MFPELVFGVVRTLGADSAPVLDHLTAQLRTGPYRVERIKLSDLLSQEHHANPVLRYMRLMDAGDQTRATFGARDPRHKGGAALALHAVRAMVDLREKRAADGQPIAWVLDGLMHPDEVEALREIYGPQLLVLSCDTPMSRRLDYLSGRLRREAALSASEAEVVALRLIHRHAGLPVPPCDGDEDRGQSVARTYRVAVDKTFPLGDVFVRCDDAEASRTVITRLVQNVLGHPFHTPTLDELGMAVAYQASLATASLSRRVGAALMLEEQIIGIGCNEVPKAGGGVYHAQSHPDEREFVHGYDPSDQTRKEILADTLARLRKVLTIELPESSRPDTASAPTEGLGGTSDAEAMHLKSLLDAALASSDVLDGKLFDILEYGRAAHAEIVAITSAARRGVRIQDATLFSTTMPCHECMRAIVAAGIRRVVYLEPYIKSRGPDLQWDAVNLVPRQGEHPNRVSIERFSGIGHRRLDDLFSWVPRKQNDQDGERTLQGASVCWDPRVSGVRPSLRNDTYHEQELQIRELREAAAIARLEAST